MVFKRKETVFVKEECWAVSMENYFRSEKFNYYYSNVYGDFIEKFSIFMNEVGLENVSRANSLEKNILGSELIFEFAIKDKRKFAIAKIKYGF